MRSESLLEMPSRCRRVPRMLLAWVLLLPLLYLTVHGRPSFRQMGFSGDQEISLSAQMVGALPTGNDWVHYSIYAAYGAILCLLLRSWKRVWNELWCCKPVIWLALLAMVSALWSQMPYESYRLGFYYLLDTLFAIYLVFTFSTEELMTLFMMLGTTVALASLFVVIALPQDGIVQQVAHAGVWRGIFYEKNDAAKHMVFLLSPVCNRRILRPVHLAYAALVTLMIVMTGSVTSMVVIAAYIPVILAIHMLKQMQPASAVYALMVALLLGLAASALIYVEFGRIAAVVGRDATLTGRTDIWMALLQSIERYPLLGYGYQAFWTGLSGESGRIYMQLQWFFSYAHSGVLEILLQLGMVGLLLVGFAFFQALRNAVYVLRYDNGVGAEWLAGLLFLTAAYNLDEGTILFSHSLVSLFFIIGCVGLAKKARSWRAISLAAYPIRRPSFLEGSARVA